MAKINRLYKIVFFAIVLSILLGYAQYYHLFNGILYRCEGFGCIGAAFVDLSVFVLTPVVLAGIVGVLSSDTKIRAFMATLGTSLLFNMITLGVLGYLHKMEVYRNVCAAIRSCQSDPRVCTWELEEDTRLIYPKCFETE